MIEIQLTKGMVAIVDDDCPLHILEMKWGYKANGYARHSANIDGRKCTILMHRLIIDAPKGIEVDHINGNKLDNRIENLRLCTRSENAKNRNTYKNNKVGFKGVFKHEPCKFSSKIYRARIIANGRKINLGYFETAEQAATAYNEAAIKYHGEFAKLNKID